jgi:hypothetical protein
LDDEDNIVIEWFQKYWSHSFSLIKEGLKK